MPLNDEQRKRLEENERSNPLGLLNSSVYQASRRNPDQAAEIIDLAEKQNLPVDTVERNKDEVKARQTYQQINLEGLQRTNPKTAQYLSNPNNAAVSIDDVDTLTKLENTLQPDHGFWENTIRGVGSRAFDLLGNLIEAGGTVAEDIADVIPNPGIVFHEDGVSWSWDIGAEDVPSILSVAGKRMSEHADYDLGYTPDFTWERLRGDITPTNAAGYIVETGMRSLPDMVAAVATLPAYLASRTEEIGEVRAEHDKADMSSGYLVEGFVPATIVSLLERIGAKAVLDIKDITGVRDVARAAGRAFVREGATEFAQEGVEYYGEVVGTAAPVNHWDALDRAFAGLVAGGPFGGAVRGTTATAQLALSSRAEKRAVNKAKTELEQITVDNIISLAQESRTNKRAQDKFRGFLQATAQDRMVYAANEDIENLVKLGVDLPQYITDQIGTDVDVSIPMDRFASEIAVDEELLGHLRPIIRLSTDTGVQADLEDESALQQLVNKVAMDKDIQDEADRIWDEVRDQLVATGRVSDQNAKLLSAIIPARAASMAEEYGMTVAEAYERMNFRVIGDRDVTTGQTDQETEREPRELRGASSLLEQQSRANQGASLKGLPTTFEVPGRGSVEFGAFDTAHNVARSYAERTGIDYQPNVTYAKLDRQRAKRIADEFDKAEHRPDDPEVKAAYDAMVSETIEQFRDILDTGLQIEFIRGEDPYESTPRLMMLDVIENNHMWVYSTRDGFGTDKEFDPSKSPMLAETEFTIDGVDLLVNDVFRVVHDYFGHVKDGVGFRAEGEENAWRSHSKMYSPLARRAMTVETRGQNSWVNYGPYGKQNRTASAADTKYADQKITLLPDWVVEEGLEDSVLYQDNGTRIDRDQFDKKLSTIESLMECMTT